MLLATWQLPPAAKSQPIGTTRGPGRPRLAVRALLEQPQFRILIDNNDLSALDDNDNDEVENAPNANASTSLSQSTNNTQRSKSLITHSKQMTISTQLILLFIGTTMIKLTFKVNIYITISILIMKLQIF